MEEIQFEQVANLVTLGMTHRNSAMHTRGTGVTKRVLWSYFMMSRVYGVPSILLIRSMASSGRTSSLLEENLAAFTQRYRGIPGVDALAKYPSRGGHLSRVAFDRTHVDSAESSRTYGMITTRQRRFSIEHIATGTMDSLLLEGGDGRRYAMFLDPSDFPLYLGARDPVACMEAGLCYSAFMPGNCKMLPDQGEWLD